MITKAQLVSKSILMMKKLEDNGKNLTSIHKKYADPKIASKISSLTGVKIRHEKAKRGNKPGQGLDQEHREQGQFKARPK